MSTRRAQILAVTLQLLADYPLEEVTTRRVAAALGLTQPALFRHFASREEMLLALVQAIREDLAGLAPALAHPDAAEGLAGLGRALLEHIAVNPGLPRLLFASALPSAGPVRTAVAALLEERHAVVVARIEAGKRQGQLDAEVDADQAAALYVALLQGLVLRWELAGRPGSPVASFEPAFRLWRRAVATRPDSVDAGAILAAGQEPLFTVLTKAAALTPGEVLEVTAPFRPVPLLGRLASLGFIVEDRPEDHGWRVTVRRPVGEEGR